MFRYPLPKHFYIGLFLIAVGWPLSWLRPAGVQLLWENSFLMLWVGYALVVDGLNVARQGSSLLTRNRKAYLGMFILSIPGWWLFEFFNLFLQNWHYIQNREVGSLEFAIRASIHFSIVIPAVLGTAELWAFSPKLSGLTHKRPLLIDNRTLSNYILIGIVLMLGVITLPRYFFPFVWVCLYLILDSLNLLRGTPSLLRFLQTGNWKPAVSLALGAITCGFFWEMWNFYAIPKWVYTVPFVNFAHIFEMPAPGYLGYLPFGLEVFALYSFLIDFLGLKKTFFYGGENYIRL